jgi:hypothetical protein
VKTYRVWVHLPELPPKQKYQVFRGEAATLPSMVSKAFHKIFDPRGSVRGSRPTKIQIDVEKVSSEEFEI